ncbi:FAD-binding domain [Leifsonia sp. C5G2]|nr:FAD-binding domain [Leifsonia sp. C5G2]
MKVLIVGAGIAGPTLAYWLQRTGHEPTLIESAPQLRQGGYLVDFWGAGFDVAERMGITDRILERGYRVREVREVDEGGRRIASLDALKLIGGADGRYTSVGRSDLSEVIFDAIGPGMETIFGQTVGAIDDDGRRVRVQLSGGAEREFDLVVGADGLHSTVRRQVFGAESSFERRLGIAVAALDLPGYVPREELVAVSRTQVGLQTLRLSLRDDETLILFTFRYDGEVPQDDIPAQQQLLRDLLRGVGWEVPAMLERLSQARTFYMDVAAQILMPAWSRGRVALIGDAGSCPSLLAGQGSALAMIEAYVLAAELHRAEGDHRAAFAGYQRRLGTFVRSKQDAATKLAGAFAPRNRRQLALRNTVIRMMGLPGVMQLAVGRSLRDRIELPAVPA